MESVIRKMQELLLQGDILQLQRELSKITIWTKELKALQILAQVFSLETQNHVENTVFDYSLDIYALTEHFVKLKLYLRRLDFDLPEKKQREIYSYAQRTNVSNVLLLHCVQFNVVDIGKVLNRLSRIFFYYEGEGSLRGRLFQKIAEEIGTGI